MPRGVAPSLLGPRQSWVLHARGCVWPRQPGSALTPAGRLTIGTPPLWGGLALSGPDQMNRGGTPLPRSTISPSRCSVSPSRSPSSEAVSLHPRYMPDMRGNLTNCYVSVTLPRRSVADGLTRMARFPWAASRQIPCKTEVGLSMASHRGLGGRRWLRFGGKLSFHPIGLSLTLYDLRFLQQAHPDPPVFYAPRLDASVQCQRPVEDAMTGWRRS